MKKYKLIKSFPGSKESGIEIGDIVIESEFYGQEFYNKTGDPKDYSFQVHIIEDYPEFWEEVTVV